MDHSDSDSIEAFSSNSTTNIPKQEDSTPSLQSIKPWFFKPRKSKYGLEDDMKKTKKFNSLHWSQEENKRYVSFLKNFSELINGDTLQKKKYHLNRILSNYIGSRSPIQCRSHHQKMIKTFKTSQAIIKHFQDEISKQFENLTSNELILQIQSVLPSSLINQVNLGINTDDLHLSGEEIGKLTLLNDASMCLQQSLWDVLANNSTKDLFDDLI